MKAPLEDLQKVIADGGSVTLNGEIITNPGRLVEAHAAYEPVDQTGGAPAAATGDDKALKAAEKRADKAEKALEPFQKRNGEQADLITMLTSSEDDLKRLSPEGLRAVAEFEGVKLEKDAGDEDVIKAILEGRKAK